MTAHPLDRPVWSMLTGRQAHLAEGGMLVAATHQPLGIEDVKTLVMKGFEYRDAEEMA